MNKYNLIKIIIIIKKEYMCYKEKSSKYGSN